MVHRSLPILVMLPVAALAAVALSLSSWHVAEWKSVSNIDEVTMTTTFHIFGMQRSSSSSTTGSSGTFDRTWPATCTEDSIRSSMLGIDSYVTDARFYGDDQCHGQSGSSAQGVSALCMRAGDSDYFVQFHCASASAQSVPLQFFNDSRCTTPTTPPSTAPDSLPVGQCQNVTFFQSPAHLIVRCITAEEANDTDFVSTAAQSRFGSHWSDVTHVAPLAALCERSHAVMAGLVAGPALALLAAVLLLAMPAASKKLKRVFALLSALGALLAVAALVWYAAAGFSGVNDYFDTMYAPGFSLSSSHLSTAFILAVVAVVLLVAVSVCACLVARSPSKPAAGAGMGQPQADGVPYADVPESPAAAAAQPSTTAVDPKSGPSQYAVPAAV